MNILMTSLLDVEHNRNGVVSFAGDLQRLFEAAGNPVRFVTPYDCANSDRTLALRIARRFRRGFNSPLLRLLDLALTLKQLRGVIAASSGTISAVIAHDSLSADAALSAVGGRCPVLLVCHFRTDPWEEFTDAGIFPKQGFAIRWLRRRMERALNDPGVVLVPVSRRNEELVRRMAPGVPDQRIALAYPGVSLPEAMQLPERHHNEVPVIINVGLLHWRKNQRLLPHLAVALKQRGFPCRFVLVGVEDPEEKLFLEQLVMQLEVTELFTFWGIQDRATVFTLLAQADLYLHTSLEESFGMTLLEAMACNIPVLALEYEALQEILTDTPEAVIAKESKPEEIATLLVSLLGDRVKLEALQIRQRALYERTFSSEAFLSRYLEIIAGAAGNS